MGRAAEIEERRRGKRRPAAFLCPRVSQSSVVTPTRRLTALCAGVPLCIAGVVLIPTPVPGIVPLTAGLALLANNFRPARRAAIRIQWTLRRARRAREVRAAGTPPRASVITERADAA